MAKITKSEINRLIKIAYKCRKSIIKMMRFGEAHLGGAFSCIDIITVLYNKILNHDPKNPTWEDRDRFILSPGHKCIALYVTLADQGYFNEEVLWTYNTFNTRVPMHPDEKLLPGIEFPTGSLGHGLSVAQGIAHVSKLNRKNYKVFVMLGDGEIAEGSIWEAVMSASHFKLDNLIVILDRNRLQVNGAITDIMNSEPIVEKFKAFGWETITINGHDIKEIFDALSSVPFKIGKPSIIVADTIKGKGYYFAENKYIFHHWHFKNFEIDDALNKVEESCNKEICKIE